MTPQELIDQLMEYYGIEVDLSYAISYVDMAGDCAEIEGFYLWLADLQVI